MNNGAVATVWIVIILGVLFLGPYFTILSLNTLFNTGIELNLYTWLSVFWLQGILFSSAVKKG